MSKFISSTVYGHFAYFQFAATTNTASDSTNNTSDGANNYYQ